MIEHEKILVYLVFNVSLSLSWAGYLFSMLDKRPAVDDKKHDMSVCAHNECDCSDFASI